MRLSNLTVKNFRALRHCDVPELGAVNLVVGKNNNGKTSILEALRLLASGGNPLEVMKIALERSELLRREDDAESWYLPRESFRQMFTGREFPEDERSIFIGERSGQKQIWLRHTYYELVEISSSTEADDSDAIETRRVLLNPLEARQLLDGLEERTIREALEIRHNPNAPGALFRLDREMISISADALAKRVSPVSNWSFVPAHVFGYEDLATAWDAIALTNAENYVVRAIQLIEPAIARLTFVESVNLDRYRRRLTGRISGPADRGPSRVPIVSIEGSNLRVPLGSFGDGIHRMLQIVLGFFAAQHGVFLIDEFENGLHYSVQPKLWALLFRLAGEFDTQVFATTHSRDCVLGFRDTALENPLDGLLFRLAAAPKDATESHLVFTYPEDELQMMTETQIEVR